MEKKSFVRTLVRLVRWLVRFGGFGALCAGLCASLVRWPCALALCAQPGLVLRLHACIPVARVSTGFSKDSLCIHCPVCRGLHIVLSDRLTGVYIDLCASKGLCAALCVEGALCVCFRLLCFWLCAPFVRWPAQCPGFRLACSGENPGHLSVCVYVFVCVCPCIECKSGQSLQGFIR